MINVTDTKIIPQNGREIKVIRILVEQLYKCFYPQLQTASVTCEYEIFYVPTETVYVRWLCFVQSSLRSITPLQLFMYVSWAVLTTRWPPTYVPACIVNHLLKYSSSYSSVETYHEFVSWGTCSFLNIELVFLNVLTFLLRGSRLVVLTEISCIIKRVVHVIVIVFFYWNRPVTTVPSNMN